MEKLEPRTYKGIDYILLTELPESQYLSFMDWVQSGSVITIQVNGSPQKNCVQYSDYSFWFDSVFSTESSSQSSDKTSTNSKSIGLAFD